MGHERQDPLDCIDSDRVRLAGQAQYSYTGVARWRVGEDVGKVEVERDQRTLLSAADIHDNFVRLPTQILFDNGMGVVSFCCK